MKKKIRVLHVIKSLGRGGAEMLLPETLRVHEHESFEFHYIYFLPWKDQMVESISNYGGKVHCFPAGNNLKIMLKAGKVARYVRENKIDLIHAHLPWAGILARMTRQLVDIPVIYTEHNKLERYHVGTRIMNSLTLPFCDHIIAVSNDVADSIRKNSPRAFSRVSTVLNGVNTSHFDPGSSFSQDIRSKFSISEDAFVVGTIAVFRFQKRLDVWMEQAKAILNLIPNAHFIIVGDGPLKDDLLNKRAQLGLTERIHMPGLEVEVRPYLEAFDVYMMSSSFEGLPIALLEAMAMGCPVVTTDAGGIKEVVRHQVDGLVCSTDKPEELASMVVSLTNPVLRKSYAASARQRVIDNFSILTMVKQLEDLYTTVTRSRG